MVTDESLLGIFIIQNQRIKYVNEVFANLVEFSIEELLNMKYLDILNLISIKDRLRLKERLENFMIKSNKKTDRVIVCLQTKFEKTIWVEIYIKKLNFNNAKAILMTIVDITHQKDIENDLRESTKKFKELFNACTDPVIIQNFENLDFTQKIQEFNDAALNLFGYSKEELGKLNFLDLLYEENKIPLDEEKLKDLILKKHFLYEVNLKDKHNKKIPAEIHCSLFEFNNKLTKFSIIRDISERKRAEKEVKTLKGLLPICAGCHKIRDDKGYWNALETYIHNHTDAEFTHGLCPDCIAKYYPEIDMNEDEEI